MYSFSGKVSTKQQPSQARLRKQSRYFLVGLSQEADLLKYSTADSSQQERGNPNMLDEIQLTSAGILEVSRRDRATDSGSC